MLPLKAAYFVDLLRYICSSPLIMPQVLPLIGEANFRP